MGERVMTAIGFVMAVVGYGVAMIANESYSGLAKVVQSFGGLLVVFGGIAMLAGVAIKLWELMP